MPRRRSPRCGHPQPRWRGHQGAPRWPRGGRRRWPERTTARRVASPPLSRRNRPFGIGGSPSSSERIGHEGHDVSATKDTKFTKFFESSFVIFVIFVAIHFVPSWLYVRG